MKIPTASIRDLRTDFARVKRRVETLGRVVITDRGEPTYVLTRLPQKRPKLQSAPDYYARLLKRQPRPTPASAIRRLWEEERGDR